MVKIKIKLEIPFDIQKILSILSENGYESYLVGGCIRNILMGLPPTNWDITTNARIDEIEKIFKIYNPIENKERLGTISICTNSGKTNISTFRLDCRYGKTDDPNYLICARTLTDDLLKRDFTVNAMAYNMKLGLIDPFNGYQDVKNKVLRCVCENYGNISGDPIRILRALKFMSQYGFSIEENTLKCMIKNKNEIKKIEKEKIFNEFSFVLTGNYALSVLADINLLNILYVDIPELQDMLNFDHFNKDYDKDVWGHTLDVFKNVDNTLENRLAALLHDIAKPKTFYKDSRGVGHFYDHEKEGYLMANKILTRMKVNSESKNKILFLIQNHMIKFTPSEKKAKSLLDKFGEEKCKDLLDFKIADVLGQSYHQQDTKLLDLLTFEKILDNIIDEKNNVGLTNLNITKEEIIQFGVIQEIEINSCLYYLLENVKNGNIKNEKKELIRTAKKYAKTAKIKIS